MRVALSIGASRDQSLRMTTPGGAVRDGRGAEAAIMAVAVCWGTTYVAMKTLTNSFPVGDFLVLRFLAAAVPLTLLSLSQLRRYTRAELAVGGGYGALLFVILYLETAGVHLSSAANGGFLIALNVVIIPVLDRLIFRTATDPVAVVFLLVALGGTALTTLSAGFRLGLGDALIVAAAVLRALQTVCYAHGTRAVPTSPLRVAVVQMWTVVLLGLAVGGFPVHRLHAVVTDSTATELLLLAYLGVLCTAAAFLAQLWAGPRLPAATTGLLLATEPIFAGLSAVLLGGEQLTAAQLAGGLLITGAAIGGRYVMSGTHRSRRGTGTWQARGRR